MIGEAPVDIADDRDGNVVEPNLDFFLEAVRRAVLAKLGERAAHPAGELLALVLTARISAQRGMTGELALGALDAFLDREPRIAQAKMNTMLHRLAARRRNAGRRLAPEQPLHDPQRRLRGPEIE